MLATRSFGNINHPHLIFLHGFLGAKEDFTPLIEHLEEFFFCFCIDLPGHGSSLYFENPIDKIIHTIQKSSLVKPVGIGYSLGGRLLMQMQQRNKNLFSSIICMSSHPGLNSPDEILQREKHEKKWLKTLEDEPLENFLTKWYQQPIFSSLQKNNNLLSALIDKRKYQSKEGLIQAMKEFALSKQNLFTGSDCKSYFLYGEMDQAYKELYLKQNWNVTVEKISQSGHAVHIENPYECASKIKQWLT